VDRPAAAALHFRVVAAQGACAEPGAVHKQPAAVVALGAGSRSAGVV
jgi:hypothetical protein